jgi:hypothetical protein
LAGVERHLGLRKRRIDQRAHLGFVEDRDFLDHDVAYESAMATQSLRRVVERRTVGEEERPRTSGKGRRKK